MRAPDLIRGHLDPCDTRVPVHDPQAMRNPLATDLVLGSLVALLIPVLALCCLVPPFEEAFAQLGIKLPALTVTLVQFSRATCRYPWLVGLALFIVPSSLGRLSGRRAALARVLLPLLSLVTWAWMSAALFVPFLGFHITMGGRRP